MWKRICDLFNTLGTFLKWVLVAGVVLAIVFMIHRHFKTHPEQLERIGSAFDQIEKKVEDRFEKDPATAPAPTATAVDPKAQKELERVSTELTTVKQALDNLSKMPRVDPKVMEVLKNRIVELEKETKELKDKAPVVDPRGGEALVKLDEERRNRETALAALAKEMAKKLEELQKATRPVEETKAQEALVKLEEERKAREDLARDMARRMIDLERDQKTRQDTLSNKQDALSGKVDGLKKSLVKTQGDLVQGHKDILTAIDKASERRSAPPVSATLVARSGRVSYSSNPDMNFVTTLRRLANVQTFAAMNNYRDRRFAEIDRGPGTEEEKQQRKDAVETEILQRIEKRATVAQESARRLRDRLAIDEVQRDFAEDVYTALKGRR